MAAAFFLVSLRFFFVMLAEQNSQHLSSKSEKSALTDAFFSSQKFVIFDEEKSGVFKSVKNPKNFMLTKKNTKIAILQHLSKGNNFR